MRRIQTAKTFHRSSAAASSPSSLSSSFLSSWPEASGKWTPRPQMCRSQLLLSLLIFVGVFCVSSATAALEDDFIHRSGSVQKRSADKEVGAGPDVARGSNNIGVPQVIPQQDRNAGQINHGAQGSDMRGAGGIPGQPAAVPRMEGEALPKQFVDSKLDKAAEEGRRAAEIKQQIENHDRQMAVHQREMEERERQRQERERLLAERRRQLEQRQQEEEQVRQHEKEREQQRQQQNSQQLLKQAQQNQPAVAAARPQGETLLVGHEQFAAAPPQGLAPVQHFGGANGDSAGNINNNLNNNQNVNGGINSNNNPDNMHANSDQGPADKSKSLGEGKSLYNAAGENPFMANESPNNGMGQRAEITTPHPAAGNPQSQEKEAANRNNDFNNVLGIPMGNSNQNVDKEGHPVTTSNPQGIFNSNNNINSNINNNNQWVAYNNNNNNQWNNNNNNNWNNNNNNWNHWNNNNNFNDFNNNNNNNNNGQQQQPQIGGINLSWDWEDFSIMFNSYGAAEMKVRRAPHPTTGEPWPLPQYYSKKDNKVYRISKDLHFIPTGVMCDVLEEGLTRHLQRVLRGAVEDMYDNLQNAEGTNIEDPTLKYEKDEYLKAPLISRVEVKVRKPCEKYPILESDESYDLVVKKKKTYIWANEVWGALRGLETFGHLVWKGTDGLLYIKETVISDYPRFPHRGLHIDTSRHYLFKEVLLDILETMEMNKLNVFHWHIVDDQSFPYESKVYPELSRKGAFHPTYVYSLEDIAEIIEFARLRGIRVMPEFDTPGHTYSWGLSRPELLTQCYSGNIPVKGYLGPIDPSKNSTYRFLQSLFQEVVDVFKDQYLHLGGDEVPLGCWQSNPEVMAFATELAKKPRLTNPQQPPQYNSANFGWSMWSDDVKRVYEYYENRLISILNEIGDKRKKGIKYIMWQEVMNNNLQLPNDTIIQVWMGDMADVARATTMGYQVLYSTCWYMDHIEYGTKWPRYYNCDPVDESYGYHINEKKVLGGEAAFWAEYFTNENLIPMMWPRASAAAERLWSSKDVKNLDKAAERLSEHRCRMIKRGISAGEISGPGYCLHPPPKRRTFNDTAGCKGGNCSRTHNFVQIEDIELHLSQRGGSIADCGNVFTRGNSNIFIFLVLAALVVCAFFAVSCSSSRLHRSRLCKNRSILMVFVLVLLVYFLCYTTIWMRAFEFSGSIHKTFQEDNRSGRGMLEEGGGSNHIRPINS